MQYLRRHIAVFCVVRGYDQFVVHEAYLSVKEWDNGYMVVQAKNYGREPEENYIDLIPILKNLLIDPEVFLAPIKEVRLRYA